MYGQGGFMQDLGGGNIVFCLGVSCLLVGIIVILEMLCFIDCGEDCDVICVCLEMDELIVVGFFIVV